MRAVNLIPKEQRGGAPVGSGRSEGAAYAVLGVLAIVAALVLLYGRAHHQIATRSSEAATLTAQVRSAQAEASKLAPYTSFVQLREQRQQAVQTLVDSRFDWAHAFHEFGRVLSAETSLSSLDGTVGSTGPATATAPAPAAAGASAAGAPSVASTTPAGSVPSFTLQGCGKSQRAVARTLERLRLIDGVSEVTLQSSAKSASGGASSSGTCPPGDPIFTALIVFDPLPSASAAAAVARPAAKTASDTSGAAVAPPNSTGGK